MFSASTHTEINSKPWEHAPTSFRRLSASWQTGKRFILGSALWPQGRFHSRAGTEPQSLVLSTEPRERERETVGLVRPLGFVTVRLCCQ